VRELTIAMPKGRLFNSVVKLLHAAGYLDRTLEEDSRKLILCDNQSGLRFILAKPTDVPTYVEYGAADLGVVGKDVLREENKDVCELLDLGLGYCRLVVAVKENSPLVDVTQLPFNSRIATKYPRITGEYFLSRGLQVDLIKLHGSIELAPIVGLAEAIVDITSSGQTLRENGLRVLAEVEECTARLIANPVSYKIEHQRISELVRAMRRVVLSEQGGNKV
jgi:ATP phosphoribosyltransferase